MSHWGARSPGYIARVLLRADWACLFTCTSATTHVYRGGPEVRAVEVGSRGPVCMQEPCTPAAGWPSAPSHSPPHALLQCAQVSHYTRSGQFWNRSFGAALTTVPEMLSRGGERSWPQPRSQPPLPPPCTPLQDPGRTQLDTWAGFRRRDTGPW